MCLTLVQDGIHGETRAELVGTLRRTCEGVENGSALLVGPAGVGKHRLLQSALCQLRTGKRGTSHDFLTVHLHPLLLPDENTALRAVAAQLGLSDKLPSSKFGSFCDGLRFVLHLLRRSKPGAKGEARREAQGQPVCFVLHEFERFAQRTKQTLLYSLYDLLQTNDAQMAVIGAVLMLTNSRDSPVWSLVEPRIEPGACSLCKLTMCSACDDRPHNAS